MLENLKPYAFWKHFEKICSIPHGSYNEKAVSDYCANFGREHGLEVYQDGLNNVVMIKPAAKGFEAYAPIIIQGHMDMVCEKAEGVDFDFEKQGLILSVVDGFVQAEGTTLGGDDGAAVAMALALVEENFPCPRLEIVLTICEETGMEGAEGVDLSMLEGKIMLNLDSEDEGIFTTSCAGGCVVNCIFELEREKKVENKCVVSINGLIGGHSGVEIDKERANANIIANRLCGELMDCVDLVSIDGGTKYNAITRECLVVFGVKCDAIDKVKSIVDDFGKRIKAEYAISDPDIAVEIKVYEEQELECIKNQEALIKGLVAMPNGVISMCQADKTLVETSLNLGISCTDAQRAKFVFLARSSVESRLTALVDQVKAITQLAGGRVEVESRYPAWEYLVESRLRDVVSQEFEEMYSRKPAFTAIHAGLECGILSKKIENLDCVSFGPDILDIHTPKERMNIESVERTYEFVKRLLVAKY